jgi:hypothetical protein
LRLRSWPFSPWPSAPASGIPTRQRGSHLLNLPGRSHAGIARRRDCRPRNAHGHAWVTPAETLVSHFGSAGLDDNLLHTDRYKWSLRFTAVNLTNKVALYNFLSTFSGTHFVTPRTETVELGLHF